MYSDHELPDLDEEDKVHHDNFHQILNPVSNKNSYKSVSPMRRTSKNDFYSDSSDIESNVLPHIIKDSRSATGFETSQNSCNRDSSLSSKPRLRNSSALLRAAFDDFISDEEIDGHNQFPSNISTLHSVNVKVIGIESQAIECMNASQNSLKNDSAFTSKQRIRKSSALLKAVFDDFISDDEMHPHDQSLLQVSASNPVNNTTVKVVESEMYEAQLTGLSLPLKPVSKKRVRNASALLDSAFNNFSSDEDVNILNKNTSTLRSLNDGLTKGDQENLFIPVNPALPSVPDASSISVSKSSVKTIKRARNKSDILRAAFVDSDDSDENQFDMGNKLAPKTVSLSSLNDSKKSKCLEDDRQSDNMSIIPSRSTSSCVSSVHENTDSLTKIGTKRKKTTNAETDAIKSRKLDEALRKTQEREAKKQEKEKAKAEKEHLKQEIEFEKTRKRMLKEADRNDRPGECLKHITVLLDTSLLTLPSGTAIATCLQSTSVHYEVHALPVTNTISFWRTVTDVLETDGKKLENVQREVVEKEIMLVLPVRQFIDMVAQFHKVKQGAPDFTSSSASISPSCTLDQFIHTTKSTLGDINLTILVQGLEIYFRQQKTDENRAHRDNVIATDGRNIVDDNKRKKKARGGNGDVALVTRVMIEEAVVSAQLCSGTSIKLLEADIDVAKLVLCFAKSIAEAPFKRNRLKTGFGMFVDGCRGVKVSKDGQGLTQVWREQLMQFKNVGAEVANAIISQYPSPRALMMAYESCITEKQAELLLQDIEVRRGAGILSTVRRIGKEVSRRVHILMTSRDANFIIK